MLAPMDPPPSSAPHTLSYHPRLSVCNYTLLGTILTQYMPYVSPSAPCTTPKDDTIQWINKMIVDGPDSWDPTFHKVKLERITGVCFNNSLFATVLSLGPPSIPSLYCSLPPNSSSFYLPSLHLSPSVIL